MKQFSPMDEWFIIEPVQSQRFSITNNCKVCTPVEVWYGLHPGSPNKEQARAIAECIVQALNANIQLTANTQPLGTSRTDNHTLKVEVFEPMQIEFIDVDAHNEEIPL